MLPYAPDVPAPKILIVDDQPINIEALYAIFQNEYEVFMATSGQQALALCAQNPPELILLDVVMPDMDGLEVCKRLKSDPHTEDIPIIFVTAHNSPQEEEAALDAGAVDFISKPINTPVVRARVRSHLTLKRQGDILRRMAFLDGLTGLANRRQFDKTLMMEWADCKRNGYWLSLVMIDIDHFKQYNDYYGHVQGDRCLHAVAKVLGSGVGRAHDLVARYGGEEFACILPNCSLEGARQWAENMRIALAALAIPHLGSQTAATVTVSIGLSSMVPNERYETAQLVELADAQLYQAKLAGRNQVCACAWSAS